MTGKKRGKKMKAVTAWGGFTDGKLDWRYEFASDAAVTVYAIYRTKREAMKQYQDVRRILISEIPSGRGK